ncbi:MAG: DUF3868 domain-containing protein [Duncaniella sp.]|nr:DUF3868 domain-containing protein [Muribaculum sp.]MCM1255100.1 DUF3868 domain-containing protein [Duncaniella sp.]
MKKALTLTLLLAAITTAANALVPVSVPEVKDASVTREGNFLHVAMDIPLSSVPVKSNTAVFLTPTLTNGDHQLELSDVAVYGRKREIYHEREGKNAAEPAAAKVFKAKEAPASLAYSEVIPWEDWMDGATLSLQRTDYGCCANIEGEGARELALFKLPEEPKEFIPVFQYVRPVAETVKSRSVTGQAFIDFRVNSTVIMPDYRRNTVELAKIRATIDSVATDNDITVRTLSIKGFASPEGSYANNERLAKGRTEALRDYVQGLYNFPARIIRTSYEPEDWEGLVKALEHSDIPNRDAIIEIANSSLDPDARDKKIKTTYPQQYAWILADVYPALRHSDYKIDFEIRSFTDVEEIKRLVKTQPQKLSLNEFFMAAQTYEPGSPDYNELFETAVRMYPDSEVANLNAANAAMQRKDYTAAAAYLKKAGDTPEAIYASGLLAALTGDRERALQLLHQAARLKVSDAPAAIEQLEGLN